MSVFICKNESGNFLQFPLYVHHHFYNIKKRGYSLMLSGHLSAVVHGSSHMEKHKEKCKEKGRGKICQIEL